MSKVKNVAVIGAGASGLTAIKCCLDEDLVPVCFERSDYISGLWHYTDEAEEGQACVMKSTVINTSKEMMSYSDFPIPKEYPFYMHNKYVDEYFHLYADKFGLKKYIRFKTEVLELKQADDFANSGKWNLTILDKTTMETKTLLFDAVMVCTGHHAEKNVPTFPGLSDFQGTVVHTHDYKTPHKFEGKRVVVIGIGNSGGDVSVELSRVASQMPRRRNWRKSLVKKKELRTDVTEDSGLVKNTAEDIDLTEDSGLVKNTAEDLTANVTEDSGLVKNTAEDLKRRNACKNELLNELPNELLNELPNELPNELSNEFVNELPNEFTNVELTVTNELTNKFTNQLANEYKDAYSDEIAHTNLRSKCCSSNGVPSNKTDQTDGAEYVNTTQEHSLYMPHRDQSGYTSTNVNADAISHSRKRKCTFESSSIPGKKTRSHISPKTQFIFGSYHQADEMFSNESKGRQCMCNSLVMLASSTCKTRFTTADINDILLEGDNLYQLVITE